MTLTLTPETIAQIKVLIQSYDFSNSARGARNGR